VLPIVVTWADHKSLQIFRDDIAELKTKCDIVVASCHWGLERDVLEYMQDIGRAAIDAGADVVFGHGPHYSLPIEVYKGKPIYYGVGSFSFHTGHGGIKHGNWVGMLAKLSFDSGALREASFQFVRHNEHNESVLCKLADEGKTFDEIQTGSQAFGTKLTPRGDDVVLYLGR
jgi:poly-gamma-glutamate synthesis protein (capsule biosynthesis protein)